MSILFSFFLVSSSVTNRSPEPDLLYNFHIVLQSIQNTVGKSKFKRTTFLFRKTFIITISDIPCNGTMNEMNGVHVWMCVDGWLHDVAKNAISKVCAYCCFETVM